MVLRIQSAASDVLLAMVASLAGMGEKVMWSLHHDDGQIIPRMADGEPVSMGRGQQTMINRETKANGPTWPAETANDGRKRKRTDRQPRSMVKYHVTRSGKSAKALEALGGEKLRVFRAILRNDGRYGLSELQAALGKSGKHGEPVNPKTVDGSVYALRHHGYIVAR